MAKLTVNLSGMEMKNPVIPASGTFGYGMDYLDFYDANILGSFSIKGTTLDPREGNQIPRICEYDYGMLNSVGLQNPGAHEVAEKIFPQMKQVFDGQVLANVSGFSVEGYAECARILDQEDVVGILELNISCPNVHGGGASFGTDVNTACEVLREVKKVTRKPVYVKCTPQCPDLVKMCVALEENGADGLVLLNTFLGIRLDIRTGKPIMKNVTGGVRRSASSDPAARMLVTCFFLHTLQTMSPERAFSPTICPSYTGMPGPTNMRPRSWVLNRP